MNYRSFTVFVLMNLSFLSSKIISQNNSIPLQLPKISSHTITIDGYGTDWKGTPSDTVHRTTVSQGEWIYKGMAGDAQESGTATLVSNNDITEVRFAQDGTYLYLLVKMDKMDKPYWPHVCMVIADAYNKTNFIGDNLNRRNYMYDKASNLGSAAQYGIPIELYYSSINTLAVEYYNGTNWVVLSSPDASCAIHSPYIEAKILLSKFHINFTAGTNITLVSALNAADNTLLNCNDYDTTPWSEDNVLGVTDVMSPNATPGTTAYNRDLKDKIISCYASIIFNDVPLPVELSNFNCVVNRNNVNLSWFTKSEVNSFSFNVERKGNNETDYKTIAEIKAAGTSNSEKSYSYIDENIAPGKYSYRLKMIDADGSFKYSSELNAEVGVPVQINLNQNYPNPFNPNTTISYTLPADYFLSLEIYNSNGERIMWTKEFNSKGYHEQKIDFNNLKVPSGLYFYRLSAYGKNSEIVFSKTLKMMYLK